MVDIEHPDAYEAARESRIVQNARKTWLRTKARNQVLNDFLCDYYGSSPFIKAMRDAWSKYGKLTDKQGDALIKVIADQQERAKVRADERLREQEIKAARSNHLGVVGQKITLTLTCFKRIEIQGTPFSYYDSGISYLFLCEDDAGNPVIYKGRGAFLDEKQRGEVTATVKRHDVYKGAKQTVLQRPKVTFIYLPKESTNG